ncbi:uncharacterized protein LOC103523915 [Trichonephila clavipes]|nr:uncharacterized protein LOC103523915 [Trichonephila clavipes]
MSVLIHDAEIEVIRLVFHQLSVSFSTPDNVFILSDSSYVFQNLASTQDKSSQVQDCRDLIIRISTKVVFQWVPSHCGFLENEMAYLLSKRGTDILQRSSRNMPLHSVKQKISRMTKKCFQDSATSAAKNKSWRVLIKHNCVSDAPRAAAVAKFRLLTGHDCLCAHLNRFNLTDSPFVNCVLLDKSWTLLI